MELELNWKGPYGLERAGARYMPLGYINLATGLTWIFSLAEPFTPILQQGSGFMKK